MNLELSLTWNTSRPAWRVRSRTFHWGPWCYTRRNAWWEWLKGFDRTHQPKGEFGLRRSLLLLIVVFGCVLLKTATVPFRRATRWCRGKCLVCGRHVGRGYRYCSLECSAYDWALKDPKKSKILFGTIKEPKRHYEDDMKGGE